MKTKIKEVHDYFKNKLLLGDFKIIKTEEHTMSVLIDNEYKFTIWIGNLHIPESRKLYDGMYNFMNIKFNVKESLKLNSIIKKPVKQFRETILYNQKLKELENLKKELSINGN